MPFDFPASPTNGQQVTGANGVVWIWDGVKWVASTAGNPFPVAPTPPPNDNDTSIATTAFVQAATATALTNVGRNLVHNAGFTVAQRGAGPFSTNGSYAGDRWQVAFNLDTGTYVINTASDAVRSQIGDEDAASVFGNSVTGNAGAAAFSQMYQRIENVRRLAGKTVTVSFWINASAAKIGVSLDQNMGTGGSPSAAVLGNGVSITAPGSMTRVSATFTLPSLSGKTLGTNNDHNTQLNLWFSSGTTQATRAGSIGVQTGGFNIWGVQLEIGSVATPLEKRDPMYEFQQCQRFYVANNGPLTFAFNSWAAGGFQGLPIYFPVPMRAVPTVTIGAQSSPTNIASVVPSASISQNWVFINATAGAAGGAGTTVAGYTASADL